MLSYFKEVWMGIIFPSPLQKRSSFFPRWVSTSPSMTPWHHKLTNQQTQICSELLLAPQRLTAYFCLTHHTDDPNPSLWAHWMFGVKGQESGENVTKLHTKTPVFWSFPERKTETCLGLGFICLSFRKQLLVLRFLFLRLIFTQRFSKHQTPAAPPSCDGVVCHHVLALAVMLSDGWIWARYWSARTLHWGADRSLWRPAAIRRALHAGRSLTCSLPETWNPTWRRRRWCSASQGSRFINREWFVDESLVLHNLQQRVYF